MALRDSYLYHVLRFLRSGQARTADDLLQLLELERGSRSGRYAFRLKGPRTVEQMEKVLIGLAEIGIVPIGRDDHGFPGEEPRWSNAGGGGGRGGSSASGGGPEGEEGRGLSEVLGHPVLFCLIDESQEALLDAAFGADPTDRQTRE